MPKITDAKKDRKHEPAVHFAGSSSVPSQEVPAWSHSAEPQWGGSTSYPGGRKPRDSRRQPD